MTEFQDIQRLIRLKRFEAPNEDFVEDFVTQFRERQRSELLRQSARGLLWERLNTYVEHFVSPKWATAATTAAVCLVGTWTASGFLGGASGSAPQLAALQAPEAVAPAVQPALAVDLALMREFEDTNHELEIENILLSRHFEGEIEKPDELRLAGVTGAAMPASGFFPVSDFSR